ncbi:MAG: hypothetical protein MUD14_24345, partial [Hydrococcus sp. Prado102]|nr:hypothetical protein [Hydrococcus sp. Prado102]
ASENAKRIVPLMAIHSQDDCTVNIKASQNIRDSFLRLWGQNWGLARGIEVMQESGVTKGTAWNHEKYYLDSPQATILETLFLKGLPHGWYGDRNGKYAFSNAPDTTLLVWNFFKSHPFNANNRSRSQ